MPADRALSDGGYDRSALAPTVVHLGPGAFHRAHQAVHAETVLRTGSRTGAVVGVSLRSPGVRDLLVCNDFRYRVVARSDDAQGLREQVTDVGAVLGVLVAAVDPGPALDALTDPGVTVVTVTVTEHGYCSLGPGGPLDLSRPEVRHDLAHPDAPRSAPGLLVEALRRRRERGLAPFAVASCDNLPGNGPATARVVEDLAGCRDPGLACWVRDHVAFPSSMVDRMVPGTPGDAADPGSLLTEPFSQWVLEDVFPAGRPPWERAGVELVADARPHEQAKLRILNGAHSALACWGLLAGYRHVHAAAADPVLRDAVRRMLADEVLPTLAAPPGWDLRRYADDVLRRFANAALPYATAKVAADGSQKLPVRVVPTVRAVLAAGRTPSAGAAVLAAWLACVTGPRAPALRVADAALPGLPARDPRSLLALPGFLDPHVPRESALADEIAATARRMAVGDVRSVLAALPGTTSPPAAAPVPRPGGDP